MVNRSPKLSQVVDYILANRRGTAFVNWQSSDIVYELMLASKENRVVVALDSEQSSIIGVILADKDVTLKSLHIKHVLTTKPGVLPSFVRFYYMMYPGWTLTATRKGKRVTMDADRLLKKLTNLRFIHERRQKEYWLSS